MHSIDKRRKRKNRNDFQCIYLRFEISWLVTVISLMLFYFGRKKNNRVPYYMAIQGILRACKSKAGFYVSHATHR